MGKTRNMTILNFISVLVMSRNSFSLVRPPHSAAVAKIMSHTSLPWTQWLITQLVGLQVLGGISDSECSLADLGSRFQVEFRSAPYVFFILFGPATISRMWDKSDYTNTLSSSTSVTCANNPLVKASHVAKFTINRVQKYTLSST